MATQEKTELQEIIDHINSIIESGRKPDALYLVDVCLVPAIFCCKTKSELDNLRPLIMACVERFNLIQEFTTIQHFFREQKQKLN